MKFHFFFQIYIQFNYIQRYLLMILSLIAMKNITEGLKCLFCMKILKNILMSRQWHALFISTIAICNSVIIEIKLFSFIQEQSAQLSLFKF